MGVETALQRELRQLDAEGSTLAETALALARKLDDEENSATSASMVGKSMIDVMRELRQHAPVKSNDSIDDLDRARQKRRQRFG